MKKLLIVTVLLIVSGLSFGKEGPLVIVGAETNDPFSVDMVAVGGESEGFRVLVGLKYEGLYASVSKVQHFGLFVVGAGLSADGDHTAAGFAKYEVYAGVETGMIGMYGTISAPVDGDDLSIMATVGLNLF